MDKETLTIIDGMVQKAADTAATNAVAQMREFHLDDLKAFGERMDMGFESVNLRIDGVEIRLGGVEQRLDSVEIRLNSIDAHLEVIDDRLDRVENALATLLQEFKEDREKVRNLEKQVSELTFRVKLLEEQLISTASR